MKKTNNILITLFILTLLMLAGCSHKTINPEINSGTSNINTFTDGYDDQTIKKFSSDKELTDYILSNTLESSYANSYSYDMRSGGAMAETAMMDSMALSNAPQIKAVGDSDSSASDYSETNVQVEGVDEPDFVKNDDKYIYMVKNNILYLVDAYPGEDAELLSETELNGYVNNIFVNDNRLIVLANDNEQIYKISQYDYVPRKQYSQQTRVSIYDISDKYQPELVDEYKVTGSYRDARMIGDYVYFISQSYMNYYGALIDTPVLRNTENEILLKPEIYYFPNPETNYNFNTVTAFNIFDNEDYSSKTFMLGYSDTIYVSEDNIYISYRKNMPWRYCKEESETKFYDVIVPLLSNDIKQEINSIKNDDSLTSEEKWSKIAPLLEEMYNLMEDSAKEDLVEEIADALEEYNVKQEIERRKTIIQKISIDDADIEYVARGEVNGYLLNQFSLDEYDGNLRVATTVNIWNVMETQVYNNVYVLDKELKQIGDIEDIAPGERIYSTRFIGNRLYMVTFKNIDPFFVIDLSNPSNPEILGELKIPGFSNYLHPYDENTIIGIGKETEGNQWGGISTAGVKIALFNVEDVNNPELITQYEIGEAGTDSEALREHKAFLFDRDKNLLVLPIREVGERYYDNSKGYYRNKIWQGAYVLNVDEESISLKGKITHVEDSDNQWYYSYQDAVRRSIFMDNYLYTISNNFLKINDLDNDLSDVNSIEFPDQVVLGQVDPFMRW